MGGSSHSARSRVVSAMLHIATVVVLVAMSVEMAPPAAVAKAPKANPPAVKAHAPEKPSKAKAKATAKTAPPTKVASLSTAYGDTFYNHDGTFTAAVSSGPINYRPARMRPGRRST